MDDLTLPEGLNADTLKNNIILECAELEVLYPAPDFFRWAVGVWSAAQLPQWVKMYSALQIEYNPLENYDRTEEWTESGQRDTTKQVQNSTNSNGTTSETSDSKHYVTGYNDNREVLQNHDTGSGSSTSTASATGTGNETGTDTHDDTRQGRIHGNIGVTTSQQMLKAEFELAPEINMYSIITREFRNRFCLLMY